MRVKHTITIWEDEEAESDITEDIEAYVMSQWPRGSNESGVQFQFIWNEGLPTPMFEEEHF